MSTSSTPSKAARTLGLAEAIRTFARGRRDFAAGDNEQELGRLFSERGFRPPSLKGERIYGDADFTPNPVIEAILSLLDGRQFQSALDPWGGSGWLLSALAEAGIVKGGTGVTRNVVEAAVADSVAREFSLVWHVGDGRRWLQSAPGLFDLVVSAPPWNMGSRETLTVAVGSDRVEVRDDASNLLILEGCLKLTEEGVGVFLVPPGFAVRSGPTVYRSLRSFGLHLEALLYLPPNSFPFTSLPGAIAIIQRGVDGQLFVGEFSGAGQRDAVLLSNLRGRKTGKDVGLGVLVDHSSFRGLDALRAEDRTRRLAARFGYPPTPLAEIVRSIRLTKGSAGFPESPDAVYVPMIGRSAALTGSGQLKLKPHNYAQLIVDRTRVRPEYLAHFLSTPLGLSIREEAQSGVTIPKLTKEGLNLLRVFLPPLAEQERVVEVAATITQVESALDEHRQRLWNEPRALEETARAVARFVREESFMEWLDRLPFPLASILWTYHTAGLDEQRRYEHLLRFFEALAEFLAAILISAVRRNEPLLTETGSKGLMAELADRHFSFNLGTFGVWSNTYAVLAKRLRTLLNKSDEGRRTVGIVLCTGDDEVQTMLTSSDFSAILEEANTHRNDSSHGGVVSVLEATRRHDALKALLGRVRRVFGTAWDRYELVLPDSTRFSGGIFKYSVRRIVGRTAPFEQREVSVAHPLEEGRLHFTSPAEPRALELIPFVRVMSSPGFAENACYFYSRTQKGNVRFVSYHFERDAEVNQPDSEVLAVLDSLAPKMGNT